MRVTLVYQLADGTRGSFILGPIWRPEDGADIYRLTNLLDFSLLLDGESVTRMPSGKAEQYRISIEEGGTTLADGWMFGKDMSPSWRQYIEWLIDHGDPWRVLNDNFAELLAHLSSSGTTWEQGDFSALAKMQTDMARIAAAGAPDAIPRLEEAYRIARVWLEVTKREKEGRARLIRPE